MPGPLSSPVLRETPLPLHPSFPAYLIKEHRRWSRVLNEEADLSRGAGTCRKVRIASDRVAPRLVHLSATNRGVGQRRGRAAKGADAMRTQDNAVYTRRDVLAGGVAAAGALALSGSRAAAAAPEDSPYGPFKMGVQSYSLRGYQRDHKADLAKALAVTQELGLKYWESYPDHIPVSVAPRELAPYKERLASAG